MKFEKVMKKFCKDIGIDKKTLMNMLLGNHEETNRKEQNNSKDNATIKESGPINTGVAAQLAYNNLIAEADP